LRSIKTDCTISMNHVILGKLRLSLVAAMSDEHWTLVVRRRRGFASNVVTQRLVSSATAA
jgi:hypothetical protein